MNAGYRRESSAGPGSRGQVGIGTLVVFIAMVLVAAVAAGVLINTASFLQATAEDAGKESIDRVVNGVEVATAAGHVTPEDAGDNVADGTVDTIRLWIRPRPAAGDINVSRLTVKWVGEREGQTLTYAGSDPAAPATGDAHKQFNASVAIGDDDEILETGEEFVLHLNVSQIESGDADATNLVGLEPGDRATVEITVATGSTSATYLNIPDYTGNATYVRL